MNQETIIRYLSGDATPEEKSKMAEWLDAEPEHMREFLSLRKLYDITLWQQNYKDDETASSELTPDFRVRKLLIEALKVAAIFIVAILGVRHFQSTPVDNVPVTMQTIHVPAGQRAELTLVDGTKVWLNAKTTFTFPSRFSTTGRNVTLNGEGYFDVTENKKQPFIVKTEKYDVKVWGTEFNVMAYSEKNYFETSLLKGLVEVLEPGRDKGLFIKPNERLYSEKKGLIQAPICHFNHFLWKDGLLSFDNESFPEMVSKLELYLDLKIEVKNKAILKYTCTGKFRTKDGIEHILKVLQLRNKFQFKIDDKLNIVTIE